MGDAGVIFFIVAVQIAFILGTTWSAYFNADDLQNFAYVRKSGLSWHFLNHDLFGHWAPGGHLLVWIAYAVRPMSWHAALLITTVFAAAGLVFLDRILRTLQAPRLVRYVLLIVFALTPFAIRPSAWFAAGVQALPALTFTLVSIDGFLRYRTTRRVAHLVECVGGFAVALLFNQLPLLLLGVLPLLALVLLPHRLTLRAASVELRKLWPVWAWLTPVAVGYILIYEASALPQEHPDVSTLLQYLWTAWSQAFVPAALGIVLGRPAHVNALVATAAQLLLASLIIVTIVRRRLAWRAWALLGIAFIANTIFVGWDRAVLFNQNFTAITATDLRYQILLFPLLLMVVVVAVVTPRGQSTPAMEPSHPRATTSRPLPWSLAGLGLVVVLVGYVVAAGASAIHLKNQSPGLNASQSAYGNLVVAPKQYIAQLRVDLDGLASRGVVSLYDEPLLVAWGFIRFPYGPASGIVPLVNQRVVFNGASRPQYLVDEQSGHVRSAHLEVHAIAPTQGGVACIGGSRAPESVTLGIFPPLPPGYWTGRIHLVPTHAASVNLVVSNGRQAYDIGDPPSWPDGTTTALAVPARTSEFVFSFLGEGHVRALRIAAAAGESLCVREVDFGAPTPN